MKVIGGSTESVVDWSAASAGTIHATNYVDNNTIYTHPTGNGNNHIPADGSSGQFLKYTSAGTAVWAADNNTTYSVQDGELSENNFTDSDHSKLDGIEASADVTDATNVTAAGALMDSELADLAAVKAINQSLVTTASPTFAYILAKIPMIQLNSTDDSTNAYQDYSGVSGGWQITWDNQEIYDSTYFTHDTATNSERITCVQAGRYQIDYVVAVNGASSADQRAMPSIKIFVNGSWHAATRYINNTGYLRRTASCNNVTVSGSYVIECDASDYISLATGFQTGFGADTDDALELRNYSASIGFTKLCIKKIG